VPTVQPPRGDNQQCRKADAGSGFFMIEAGHTQVTWQHWSVPRRIGNIINSDPSSRNRSKHGLHEAPGRYE